MKSLITILAYSHTDVSDVWPAFFGRIKNYMSGCKLIFLVNKDDAAIPDDVIKIFYDDKNPYAKRLNDCISLIDEEVFLFMHEDMILYDYPLYDDLKNYFNYVKNDIFDSIKLIYVGDDGLPSDYDNSLFIGHFSKFSIQPTIIKKDKLLDILQNNLDCSIWELENSIKQSKKHVMSRRASDAKRGLIHYDSAVFPYIATALVKGKWNVSEYPKELNEFFLEYNVNPHVRGII